MRADVCVVGGGLAGLSAALKLRELGIGKVVVFEGKEELGGLLKTVSKGGFTFDAGGSHILFSKDAATLKEMLSLLGSNYLRHRRNTKIYYGGRFVKYPFENGLSDLPPEERYECLKDVVENYVRRVKGELPKPRNFLEWLRYVFGDAIAEKYLIPYNRKLWKTDLTEITLEWVGGRVPNPPIHDIMKAAVGLSVEGYTHQLNFYYPREGGIHALIEGLVKALKELGVEILTNSPVISVEKAGKVLRLNGGALAECGAVVHTAPLNDSWASLKDVLGGEAAKLRDLKGVSVAVVGLGVKGEAPPYHWIYFPQAEVPFHRVALLSNFSPRNAPPKHHTLIAEVSFRDEELLRGVKDSRLVKDVVEGLERVGLLNGDEALIEWGVWRWRNAYVLYNFRRAEVLKEVLPRLKEVGVFPHGRFGRWEYLNMDAVYRDSARVASEVIDYLRKAS